MRRRREVNKWEVDGQWSEKVRCHRFFPHMHAGQKQKLEAVK